MGLKSLRRSAGCILAGLLYLLVGTGAIADVKPLKLDTTADHSKFKELQQEFQSGAEVTKACLSCHTEASKQIHQTLHWKWEVTNPATGQELGKRNVINNFCTSAPSNYKACASCHIG